MSLIRCTDCGKKLSLDADKCPNCFCPVDIILDKLYEKSIHTKEDIEAINNIAALSESLKILKSINNYKNSEELVKLINDRVKCLKDEKRKNNKIKKSKIKKYAIAFSSVILVLLFMLFCIKINEKKYSLIIYNTNWGSICYSSFIDEDYECGDSENLEDIHIEIKVANPDAFILDYSNEYLFDRKVNNGDYVLYYDNSVYLYNAQTKTSKSLKINFDEWDSCNIERENINMLPHGIVCSNAKNGGAYYNLENDTMMYRGYYDINYAGYGFLSASKRKCVDGKFLLTLYLLSSEEEKVIEHSEETYSYGGYYTVEYTDGEYYTVSTFLPWKDDDERVYCK